MNREKSIADGPDHGDLQFFEGSITGPKGYWARYDKNLKEWVPVR